MLFAGFFLLPSPASAASYTSTRTISGANGLVIDGDSYTASSGRDCLRIVNSSNITVRNSTFRNCRDAIQLVKVNNITIEKNRIERVMRGIGSDASRQIVIQRNTFKNMVG